MRGRKILVVLWALAVLAGWNWLFLAFMGGFFGEGEMLSEWILVLTLAGFVIILLRARAADRGESSFPDMVALSLLPLQVVLFVAVSWEAPLAGLGVGVMLGWFIVIVPAAATAALGWFWPEEEIYLSRVRRERFEEEHEREGRPVRVVRRVVWFIRKGE